MAVTDVNLDTWEQRLQTAFLVALQGDFANRLTLVKNKASQHLERARRAKDAARKANDIRTRILDRILTECVDHFACAVPLSIIEDMREHSGPEAMCPICHHPFTDTNACSIEELLADFPVRIKYCGHIVGKSCLEQWMDTPKIDEAKYPDRSCPLCRVNIEGVAAPAVPAKTSDHVKRDLTAILNRRKLEEMGECDLEFAECLNAISACISEEIAVGELMAVLSTEKNQLNTRLEVQKAFLQEKLEMLKMERWIWGFRDNVAWKKARGDAGANVAEHLRETLADYIDAALSKTTSHSQEAYKIAIQEALDQVDKHADQEGWDDGSTLALALIDTSQKILVEADVGDSHVMLAEHTRRNQKEHNKLSKLDHTLRAHNLVKGKNEWSITRLSTPHDPDNPVEKKRIEDAGGEVNYDTGTPRVDLSGALAMSRSMGDLDLKLPRVNRLAGHNLTDLDGVETGLKPGRKASANLVINKAHFSVRDLSGGSLLFLSSDGIGDASDAEVATQQATRWRTEGRPAKQIAADMATRAGKVKNSDNVTVLVVYLETSNGAQ
ncbi:hypothetical protein N0V95_004690 [Ascochyta clinopodiicola]|nr:hypothetical protein N0V95_004690 [Ascochyta clinopodiicola]